MPSTTRSNSSRSRAPAGWLKPTKLTPPGPLTGWLVNTRRKVPREMSVTGLPAATIGTSTRALLAPALSGHSQCVAAAAEAPRKTRRFTPLSSKGPGHLGLNGPRRVLEARALGVLRVEESEVAFQLERDVGGRPRVDAQRVHGHHIARRRAEGLPV